MQLVMSEEQQLLAKTARDLVREQAPVARLRSLREDPVGYDPALYRRMAELGWMSLPIPERDGGLGLGLADVICVTEALGRGLASEPYLSSFLCGQLLARAGNEEQKSAYLAPLMAGEAELALAYAERGQRFDWQRSATHANATADGFELSGEKQQVLGATRANAFIVVARTSNARAQAGDLSLFVVPRGIAGVSVTRQWRIDAAPVARLLLSKVRVPRVALLGTESEAEPLLADTLDRATVALSAEMLGAMSEAFERTLAYLKERVQFGVAIGSFQALKHRAARLYIEIELTRSAVLAAARTFDAGAPGAAALASVAKARASDAFLLIANEAVQMHGGVGMTDEHDIGFFLKRARACEMTFGDAAFHRDRFAKLSSF
ncbi:MAG TPA: acyl-CoA dehydrogenase [Polyangiaceae bacterium]|nr:acyl-CoA dehydrogenase [Polyangiaceae bacterium]